MHAVDTVILIGTVGVDPEVTPRPDLQDNPPRRQHPYDDDDMTPYNP